MTTVSVKQGFGPWFRPSRFSAQEARRLIRAGIRQAVDKHRANPIEPLVWPGPYVLEKRYFHTDTADAAASQPGVERVDSQTVRITSDNIRDVIYR